MALSQSTLAPDELSAFCSQMSMLLQAGISERESLCILKEDMQDAASAGLLSAMAAKSETGAPFSEVLEDVGVFPRYLIDMVRVGESAGRLDDVLNAMTDYYEREKSIKESVKNAVAYPSIMLLLMLVVILVLSVKVLPIFSRVFSQLGAQVSVFARGILNLGSTLGRISGAIIALLITVAVLLALMRLTKGGRRALTVAFSAFPLTKSISSKTAMGRFAGAMALMLSSGMDVDHALDMAGRLVDHPVMTPRVTKCKAMISQGTPFAQAISECKIFSGVYARMVSVGFKTGSVDKVFAQLADKCENEISDELSRIVGIIEPSLVALLSMVVGLILLSVMLPLMGIMSSMI